MPGYNEPPRWLAPWILAPVGALFLGFGIFVLSIALGVIGEGAPPLAIRLVWVALGVGLAALGFVVLRKLFARK